MLTLDRVYKAKRVLSEVVRQTDMIRAKNISSQCDVYLKTENLQVTGSFKVRGSYFKISQLSDEEKKKGVIACSAGNHAQGVALAATKNGIKLKGVIKDGVQIVAGLIALIAVIKIGLSTATKSIMSGQELSQKETKDVITKLGYLIIGLSVMLFASSIADFITQKL